MPWTIPMTRAWIGWSSSRSRSWGGGSPCLGAARGVRSEEVAQLEVQLEPRRRGAEGIGAVEAVCPVDPDRPEGRDDAQADAGTTEQAGRIELAGVRPHVPRVHEHVDIE